MSRVEEELRNFAIVWILAVASTCFCHNIAKIVRHGLTRFVILLPVMLLLLVLPLKLRSVLLAGFTSFFIAWLATFKLLLFAFGKGPLSANPPHSLLCFISLACFPIKLQENDDYQNHPSTQKPQKPIKKAQKSLPIYLLKALIFITMFIVYQYKPSFHPKLYLFFYSIYIYTSLEIMLAIVATLVRSYLRVELEPQFDDPYLATSVQDFWGRRWNIMVSKVLRPTVYVPVRTVCKHVVGENWAAIPAIVAVFIVSGIMHEWLFYIIGRCKPTWEVTIFFVLHGICMALEIIVKRIAFRKWRLPPLVSGPMVLSFVMITSVWLFLPGMMRCQSDTMVHREMAAFIRYVKDLGARLGVDKCTNSTVFSLHNGT